MGGMLDEVPVIARVRGVAASGGCALGRARLVREVAGLALVEAGEVAVLGQAWPVAGAVLGRAAAVVAERGGPLCSLGTLARESGVPCVVAAAGACEAVADGALVFVDADAGVVAVLG